MGCVQYTPLRATAVHVKLRRFSSYVHLVARPPTKQMSTHTHNNRLTSYGLKSKKEWGRVRTVLYLLRVLAYCTTQLTFISECTTDILDWQMHVLNTKNEMLRRLVNAFSDPISYSDRVTFYDTPRINIFSRTTLYVWYIALHMYE